MSCIPTKRTRLTVPGRLFRRVNSISCSVRASAVILLCRCTTVAELLLYCKILAHFVYKFFDGQHLIQMYAAQKHYPGRPNSQGM